MPICDVGVDRGWGRTVGERVGGGLVVNAPPLDLLPSEVIDIFVIQFMENYSHDAMTRHAR